MTLAMRLSDRPAWAEPRNYELDLRDLMDEYYGRGLWSYRTGVNLGSDFVPALHLGCDRIRVAYGYGAITIPPRTFIGRTPIDPAKLSGISLLGHVSGGSVLVWAGAGHFTYRSGAAGYGAYRQEHLAMLREDGFSGGVGWLDKGDAAFEPGQITGCDIYMSGIGSGPTAGRWSTNLMLDGNDKTTGAAGIRVADLRNLQLFNSGAGNAYAVGLFNVRQAQIENLGTYGGTGTLAGDMYVGGVGGVGGSTQQVSLERLIVGGKLEITNSADIALRGSASVFAANNTADWVEGWLRVGSSIGALGPNSNLTLR